MADNMEPQPRETGVILNRASPRRGRLIKGASFLAGAATLLSSVGCNDTTAPTLPTPVIPAATSTLRVENSTPNITTPKPATATQESNPAPTATAKVEATPTPAKIELPFPYELAVSNEYQGPDIKVILGVDKAVYNRPAGNTCQTLDKARNDLCPAIKNLEISDKWLKQMAPNQYPNGMSQEEMVQRLNDTVLLGHLANLHQNPTYKDLTLQGLKDLIHQNKAPEYSIRWPNGDSISVNTGNPVYIVAIDKPGTFDYITTVNFDYSQRKGSLIIGIWDADAMNLAYPGVSGAASGRVIASLITPSVRSMHDGNANFLNDLVTASNPLKSSLLPYQTSTGSAGIIVASGN